MTTSKKEIDVGRQEAFNEILKELEYPEKIWIYKINS